MRPTLILLPGLLCDARLWRDQARALEAVAAPEVADLSRDDSLDDMARRVLRAAPERFALAGLSMGGYVALAVTRLAPERVSHLCLLDTSARADTEEQRRRRRGLIALARTGRFRGVTPQLLPLLLHPDRLDDAALVGEVTAMADRVGRDAFLRQQAAILGRPDARPGLGALRVPTLVAVGDADALTPPELSREMASLIPGARLAELPRCGHLSTLEMPDAVAALMRAWLAA